MLSPKAVKLMLAVALFLGLVTVLSATMSPGRTASTNPITRKILRRYDKTKLPATAAEIALLRSQEQVKEERELEDTVPKHVPIKVKIKAEKEKAFKDLDNENWLRDLEIEVKNTGTKPIYFLELQVYLPETRGPDGNIVGFGGLFYGRTDLISISAPLKADDVPLKPGETHIFTIPKNSVGGWKLLVRDDHISQPKKVRVIFQFINFGDGTGFWGTTAAPLPHPKRAANSMDPCTTDATDHPKDPTVNWPLVALNHGLVNG